MARVDGLASRRRGDLVMHRAYPVGVTDDPTAARSVITSDSTGLKAVCPALAVLGTAMIWGDAAGVVAADRALHDKQTTLEELELWLGRLARHPGLPAARRAVARA